MKQLIVEIPASQAYSYPFYMGAGLLNNPEKWLSPLELNEIVVITDHTVKEIYGYPLVQFLKDHYRVLLLSFPPGEKSKNSKVKQSLEEEMLRHRFDRDALCIALGGGVVGDITGYVAGTYMRGVPYLQVPTTLLAMVDSSVGGKTGIDTIYGKNLVGVFWQPKAVVVDINCLKTLSREHFICGLIEGVKMFLTSNKDHFHNFAGSVSKILKGDDEKIQNFIFNAVKIKADIIHHDEKENNQRRILNFGHTIGHALERVSNYTLLHGYAVGLGILVEAKIAELLGILTQECYAHIQSLLLQLDIVGKRLEKFDIEKIIHVTQFDKKSYAGNVNYILLEEIGRIYKDHERVAHHVQDAMVEKAILEVMKG